MTHCRRPNLGLDLADIDKTDYIGIVGDETGFSTTSHLPSYPTDGYSHGGGAFICAWAGARNQKNVRKKKLSKKVERNLRGVVLAQSNDGQRIKTIRLDIASRFVVVIWTLFNGCATWVCDVHALVEYMAFWRSMCCLVLRI